ncbi:putative GPN-loop GTPase [Hamiltosporidium tvaerminnensis]|uniref:GPN-loop GTPase 2 n=1 Tax=Hamiltosporidium tvaerminnensis TaxID=1176355 RepID=A0A4Q9M3Z4_9MICR|nr:putative GPN-loop GTPase [Hamiltosporidium tvaerminnensis]
MAFAEVIIGPPGGGKTTYILRKKEFLKNRNLYIVNLDPGNEILVGYHYDIRNFDTTKEYMKKYKTGPNLAVKEIINNFTNSFKEIFDEIIKKCEDSYFLFDCPGQVEFFMTDSSLKRFIGILMKQGIGLTVVNLVDSVFFVDKHAVISTYLLTTISMILLEAPHITVISKCDNLKNYKLQLKLSDIIMCRNLKELLNEKDTKALLYKNMIEVIENESLIIFEILDYNNMDTLIYLQQIIDKANGYIFDIDYENYEFCNKIISKEDFLEKY